MSVSNLVLTLIVAVGGGFAGIKSKIPAGALLGSLLTVSVFQVFTGIAVLPPNIKLFAQIISGLFIGKNINRQNTALLPTVILPAIVTTVCVLGFSMIMGFALHYFTPYDLKTTLFSCAPGGIIDMTLAGQDLGADASIISVLQLGRLISVMAVLPTLIWKCAGKGTVRSKPKLDCVTSPVCQVKTMGQLDCCTVEVDRQEEAASVEIVEPENSKLVQSAKKSSKIYNAVFTFIAAAIFGYIGYVLHVPAGAIVFAMIGSAMVNLAFRRAYMPVTIKRVAQICAGAVIGLSMTAEAFHKLTGAIIPAVIILVGFVAMNVVVGYLIHRFSDLDLLTSLFCCCPGGMSDVVLIADDFGADTPKLTVVQLFRCVCTLGLYPTVIYLVTR